MAACCPDLVVLHMQGCYQVTDRVLDALALYCHRLEDLDVTGCTKISDVGLRHLTKQCFHLKSLSLWDCNISDLGLEWVALGCRELKSLNIAKCRYVTDHGVEYIARYCHDLEYLNMAEDAYISDIGLALLAHGCHHLKSVDVSYNGDNMTMSGLARLLDENPEIEELNLFACAHLLAIMEEKLNHQEMLQDRATSHMIAYCAKLAKTDRLKGINQALKEELSHQ